MNRRDLFKMAALLPFAIPAISVKATAPEPKLEVAKLKKDGTVTVLMGMSAGAKKLLAEHIRSNRNGALAVFELDDPEPGDSGPRYLHYDRWMKQIEKEVSQGFDALVIVPDKMARSQRLLHDTFSLVTSIPSLLTMANWVIELRGYGCCSTITDPTPSLMSWTCRTVTDRFGIFRDTWTWDTNQPWRVFWQMPLKDRWTMSVQEARDAKVCRVCQVDDMPRPGNSLVLNYGEEYGHQKCLNDFGIYRPPTQMHRMD